MNDNINAYPLAWPDGWKREKQDQTARFSRKTTRQSNIHHGISYTEKQRITVAQAVKSVLHELKLMGYPDYMVIISTNLKLRQDGLPYSNQKEPEDKGAAVWFREYKDGSQQQVIALDKYDRVADNLYAIGKTVEAMRGIERWGGGEILNRTFTGFAALPPAGRSWRDILNCHGARTMEDVKKAYHFQRRKAHPDAGGTTEQFYEVQQAFEDATKELGY